MKLVLVISALLLATTSAFAQRINIGDPLPEPNNRVEDINGRTITLSEVYKPNGLIVVFSSNTCPMVRRWEQRFMAISRLSKASNMGMIVLNSNEDYRDRGDGMDDMIKHSRKAGYDFPYVLDKNHVIANSFGATKTPEVFLFDGTRTLVYTGAIDDNAYSQASVKNKWLENAINALVAGDSIETSTTDAVGCSIKRVN